MLAIRLTFVIASACSLFGSPAGAESPAGEATSVPALNVPEVLAARTGEITPIEAAHLFERQVRGVTVSDIKTGQERRVPIYVVRGSLGHDTYTGYVDARTARLLSVVKKGRETWKWDGVRVVAHRGAAKFAPENTIAAFNKAAELGADLIEFDVRQTKDGQLVVMHDPTVDRTTDGCGQVAGMTLAEVKELDAGAWFDARYRGERVPTLQDTLDAIRGQAFPNIDFKAGSPEKLVAQLRAEERINPGFFGDATFNSHDHSLLVQTLSLEPRLRARPIISFGRAGLALLLQEFDPPIVNVNWQDLSEPLIRDIHLAGKKAFVSILGEYDTRFGMLAAIEAGADYIQSDNLDILMPLLRTRGLHR